MLEGTTKPRKMEEQIKNIQRHSRGNGESVGNGSRLVIIQIIKEKRKRTIAVCRCNCGTIKSIPLLHVKSGAIKSCGCLRKETSRKTGLKNRKHGQSIPGKRSPAYRSWETMKARCFNKKDPSFYLYGGRGITVCKRWIKSFENFLLDMGERPKNTTIDRIDNDKDYFLSNCRWAKPKIQQRNKRNNRLVYYKGEEMPLVILAEKTGVPYQRLHERIVRRGWAVESAVNKPPRGWR